MTREEILSKLKLGEGIAEYDENLAAYFIDTVYVEDFIDNRYDIILGEKGSGKSAMLIGVSKNVRNYKSMENVQLVIATNLTGDPDFKKAFSNITDDISDAELVDAWKIYIINLLWKQFSTTFSEEGELKKYLEKKNVIENGGGFLSKLKFALNRSRFKKVSLYNKMKMDGTNEIGGSIDLGERSDNVQDDSIDFNYIFDKLNSELKINDSSIWILMDRLDDAFPDRGEKSIKILKTLFEAYKDICAYGNIKMKIFIREDIFEDITKNGFRSLTHVAAKTMQPIKWDREKIVCMFIERLLYNSCIREYLRQNHIAYDNEETIDYRKILDVILKKQIDVGKNNPDSIGWVLNHIKDGKGVFTPRDFILLIDKARAYQLDEIKVKDNEAEFLIGASAMRKAYKAISKIKLTTQLYAEYPEYRKWIEKFENGKSQHNEESLKEILGKHWKSRCEKLVQVGFLEKMKGIWNIPFIYRPALHISQGKSYK